MKIVDQAISPYWIESDYNGLTLWEPNPSNEKSPKKVMSAQTHEMPNLMGEIIRRKLSSMEGEVTLKEFTMRLQGLQTSIQNAMDISFSDVKDTKKEPVATKEMIS